LPRRSKERKAANCRSLNQAAGLQGLISLDHPLQIGLGAAVAAIGVRVPAFHQIRVAGPDGHRIGVFIERHRLQRHHLQPRQPPRAWRWRCIRITGTEQPEWIASARRAHRRGIAIETSATEGPGRAMPNVFTRQIVLKLAVAHAGEIVPALVVVGGVLDAEMPKLVGAVAALGCAVESRVCAPYMIARRLAGIARSRLRTALDADVDELRAVFKSVRHCWTKEYGRLSLCGQSIDKRQSRSFALRAHQKAVDA